MKRILLAVAALAALCSVASADYTPNKLHEHYVDAKGCHRIWYWERNDPKVLRKIAELKAAGYVLAYSGHCWVPGLDFESGRYQSSPC